MSYLKEFVHLAGSLSFKRTAEYFYVSRSVISRHLASIEEALGAKLVDRTSQGVQLTEIGEVFYRDALTLLRDYATAVDHVREAQLSQARIVRVGYLRNAARPVLAQFVNYLGERHPDLYLSMTYMEYIELRRSMDNGAVDVAIGVDVAPEVSRGYRKAHLYTDRFFAVAGKSGLLGGGHAGETSADDTGMGSSSASAKAGPAGTPHDDVTGLAGSARPAGAAGAGAPEAACTTTFADLPQDRLLLPDSFVYAGVAQFEDGLVEERSQLIARACYNDIDTLLLRVRTQGYVALSSGLNNAMLGGGVALSPLAGPRSTFSVSAFFRDGLDDDIVGALSEACEHCQATIREQQDL